MAEEQNGKTFFVIKSTEEEKRISQMICSTCTVFISFFFFLACVNSETCFTAGVFSTNGGTYKFLKITHTHTDTYAQEKSRVESEITKRYIY